MPTVSHNDKVLVTGANGYIGTWLVQTLLQRGYSVRAAVRSEAKGRSLLDLFESHGTKLELAIVPDMSKDGAWDNAVQSVQAIVHTATPIDRSDPNPKPEDFIEPAIQGTVGILESARKFKNGIKRVVITSSVGAVVDLVGGTGTGAYTEEDWNDGAVKAVEEKGVDAGVMDVYSASKVLAERAAWAFHEKHKSEVEWDLTVIVPPATFGGMLSEARTPEALNASLYLFWIHVVSDSPKPREVLGKTGAWVDIRDLCEAFALSLEKKAAGGERFLISASCFVWQDFVDIANELDLPGRQLPPGFPDIPRNQTFSIASTKARDVLGLTYRSQEESTRHTLEYFAGQGL